ncbi:MAG: methionyl-tRNA formyltransferase [Firmicutes bacterium]|nr:methionyl-tRNA formyltransferase [Bacillota bacterium]
MKIIFMGTPEFAAVILEKLISSEHEVAAVVTQPDKPTGRKKKLTPPPVKVLAETHKIPVHQPEKIRNEEFYETLRGYGADIMIVAAYGKILPPEILYMTKFKSINVHGSLLPHLRGAAPIQRAIMNGDKITGVTTMLMSEGLDTGDMLLKAETAIEENEDFGSLYARLADMGAKLLLETLERLPEIVPEPQDDSLSSYAPMLSREDELINWNESAQNILNRIRALSPAPGAFCRYKDKTLKIFSAEINADLPKEAECGSVVSVDKKGFSVMCADMPLKIKTLQPQGGKLMDAGAFLRGHSLAEGDTLN